MSKLYKRSFVGMFALVSLAVWSPLLSASPSKTEDQLIQMLQSRDGQEVVHAIERLPDWYPKSTNAISAIKEILKNKEVVPHKEVNIRNEVTIRSEIIIRTVCIRPNILARKAARAISYEYQ